jgi:hypothetical protein
LHKIILLHLRSLTKLHLHDVCATGDEFACLLSNAPALMQLELAYCNEIICLKTPCMLEQFSCLTVSGCSMLQIIESKAPNLSTTNFEGNLVQLSLGQPLNATSLDLQCSDEPTFCVTLLPSFHMLCQISKLFPYLQIARYNLKLYR